MGGRGGDCSGTPLLENYTYLKASTESINYYFLNSEYYNQGPAFVMNS